MDRRPLGGLQLAAVLLGVLSFVMVLGASVTAAVVQHRDDPSGTEGLDGRDSVGWSVVRGTPGPSDAPALYRVPEGWDTQTADKPVQYTASDGSVLASGHSTSLYYGNDCSQAKARIAGGWAALADTDAAQGAGDDLVDAAEKALRAWGTGYATHVNGATGPMTAFPGQSVELDDGTTAGRARMEIDMSAFEGACLPDTAEIMVTSIRTADGVKSLVQARYLLKEGAISDEQWSRIADSLSG
ncbi:MAG: hypothetical protein L0H93_02805 [Nocardioides sp.]|nr:hypothetical protein [Nocardioides sp.]